MRNIVEVRIHDPKVASTRVRWEDENAWVVGCERDNCPNEVGVSKVSWRPVDFAKPEGDCIEIRESTPGRRFCAAH
jgi:hypothetical protein